VTGRDGLSNITQPSDPGAGLAELRPWRALGANHDPVPGAVRQLVLGYAAPMEWTPARMRMFRETGLCLSQEKFAKAVGFAMRTIGNAERGAHSPSLALRRALDEALENASDAQRDRFLSAIAAHNGAASVVNGSTVSSETTAVSSETTAASSETTAAPETPAFESIKPFSIKLATAAQMDHLLAQLRDQWHLLVKADNILGPRYALRGVHTQLQIISDLLGSASESTRLEVVKLGAQYAESAAWLYEDSGNLSTAHYWNSQAMEWAHEADDRLMLSWTLFRRSQHALAGHQVGKAISLVRAAGRERDELPTSMLAAIAQQEAQGYALDGRESASQHKFDEAHKWAATDVNGDAREGHGSFCTASYIELQRAGCWLTLGRPERAIQIYETTVPELPVVYRRDRGMALGRFAAAYVDTGEPEQAARIATEALSIAQSTGSTRTLNEVMMVGRRLTVHRKLPPVAQLLDELTIYRIQDG